jgi:hypothetical protein
MEQPGRQFEMWPKKITPDELNEELRKAGNYGQRKGEDLVSKEKTTKALEGKDAIPTKISFKENIKRVQGFLEELKEKEKDRNKKEEKS